MRNFMGYDRRWLDEPHVGDHVGRTVWALGEVLSTAWAPGVVGPTGRLLGYARRLARPATVSLRTAAYASSASPASIPTGSSRGARRCSSGFVDQLARRPTARRPTHDWRWFEDAPDATTTPACRTP